MYACYLSKLFRSPGQWDKFDLDRIFHERYFLLKSIAKFKYLGIEELLTESSSVNV